MVPTSVEELCRVSLIRSLIASHIVPHWHTTRRTDNHIAADDGGLVPGKTGHMENRRVSHRAPGPDGDMVHVAADHRPVPQRRAAANLCGPGEIGKKGKTIIK